MSVLHDLKHTELRSMQLQCSCTTKYLSKHLKVYWILCKAYTWKRIHKWVVIQYKSIKHTQNG